MSSFDLRIFKRGTMWEKISLTQGGPMIKKKRGGKGELLKWGILENFPTHTYMAI